MRDRGLRWWARRVIIVSVVVSQAVAVAAAYDRPHKVFGWQMFDASSDWQAEIFRVTADGQRHDVREPWPGGYVWADLVATNGLDVAFVRSHAGHGLDTTLNLFQHALDWVAENTPDDGETIRLEAVVSYWDNGRPPEQVLFTSLGRVGMAP